MLAYLNTLEINAKSKSEPAGNLYKLANSALVRSATNQCHLSQCNLEAGEAAAEGPDGWTSRMCPQLVSNLLKSMLTSCLLAHGSGSSFWSTFFVFFDVETLMIIPPMDGFSQQQPVSS